MRDIHAMHKAKPDRSEIAKRAAETRWAQTPRVQTLTKGLRVEPDIWLKVIDRAAAKKVTPNEWVVRCIKDAMKRLELEK